MSARTDGLTRNMAAFVEELGRHRNDVVRLAESVSLAACVEPSFLRRARLRFLPRSTAGLEAALWFSPLVEAAGEQALLLDPEAAEVLRGRLARRPERAEAVRRFTEEAHEQAPRVIRFYEHLLWTELDSRPGDTPLIRRELGKLLETVAADGRTADDLSRWALHYIPRLPSRVLQLDEAWRIQMAAAERLGLDPPEELLDRPASAINSARALAQQLVPIGVMARSNGIVLSRPPAEGTRTIQAPAGRRARFDLASPLAHHSEPVRLELEDGQRLRLPFTVVQRRDLDGSVLMSAAHPGTAIDIAVASGVRMDGDPGLPACAVLLSEGSVVLHAPHGAEIRRVAVLDAALPRQRLALSADGRTLTCKEGGGLRRYRLPNGKLLLLPEGAGFGRVDALLNERRAVRGLWTGSNCSIHAAISRAGTLTAWDFVSRDIVKLATNATAVTGTPDGRVLAWATSDGAIWCRLVPRHFVDPLRPGIQARRVGQAPWHVLSLALSPDGDRVMAAGHASRVLHWSTLVEDATAEEMRLPFCATRVFGLADGTWMISGVGGPAEVRTEDGRGFLVTPDAEADVDFGDVPGWVRGCVMAVPGTARPPLSGAGFRDLAAEVPAIREAGADCLVVGPVVPTPSTDVLHGMPSEGDIPASLGGIADALALLAAAHDCGLRLVVEMHLPQQASTKGAGPERAGLLNSVRQWLDTEVDGLLIRSRPVSGNDQLLRDLRHLVGGYPDCALIYASDVPLELVAGRPGTPEGDAGQCHVVAASAITGLLADAVLHPDWAVAAEKVMEAMGLVEAAGPRSQWGYPLSTQLSFADEELLAGLALSLPGCPMLSLPLLRSARRDGAVPLRRMLEQRRNQLPLLRGTCEMLRLGIRWVIGLIRQYGEEAVLCLVNLHTDRHEVVLSADYLDKFWLLDLLDGTALAVSGDSAVRVALPPRGIRWLRFIPLDTP